MRLRREDNRAVTSSQGQTLQNNLALVSIFPLFRIVASNRHLPVALVEVRGLSVLLSVFKLSASSASVLGRLTTPDIRSGHYGTATYILVCFYDPCSPRPNMNVSPPSTAHHLPSTTNQNLARFADTRGGARAVGSP